MAESPRPQNREDQWITITDFTPGIVSRSAVVQPSSEYIPAKPGSADAAHTWCCIGLPSGGLGPLPACTAITDFPEGASDKTYITGFTINPMLQNGDIEAVYMEEVDDGTNHYFNAFSYPIGGTQQTIVSITADTTTGFFCSPFPTWSRMANTDPTTTVGAPVLVFPAAIATDTNGTAGHLYVYPDPSDRTSIGAADLVTKGSEITGQIVGYQNRILAFSGIDYDYPIGNGVNVNEQIEYTDPPNSTDYGNQQTVLVAENPWGYGCAGSISAGELFLVKKIGGGVYIYGDIDSPNVTYLPGVQPTGDLFGKGESCSIGYIYCSQNNGAWLWNGGNTSQKISNQISDDFFDCTSGVIASNNMGFYVQRFGSLIVFSNNYIYDTVTNSWWRLYPNGDQSDSDLTPTSLFWWAASPNANQVYGAPVTVKGTTVPFIFKFDSTVPTKHYQWRSTVLPLTTRDRVIDVREIVVKTSCSETANGTVTVDVISEGSSVYSESSSAGDIGKQAVLIRFNVGEVGLVDPQIQIRVDTSDTDTPIIHEVSMKYITRQHVAAI